MWINEVAPERLAELFHHYHQALMPELSGKGGEERSAWKEVPQKKRLAWLPQRVWRYSNWNR